MYNNKIFRLISLWITLIFLVVSCSPPGAPPPVEIDTQVSFKKDIFGFGVKQTLPALPLSFTTAYIPQSQIDGSATVSFEDKNGSSAGSVTMSDVKTVSIGSDGNIYINISNIGGQLYAGPEITIVAKIPSNNVLTAQSVSIDTSGSPCGNAASFYYKDSSNIVNQKWILRSGNLNISLNGTDLVLEVTGLSSGFEASWTAPWDGSCRSGDDHPTRIASGSLNITVHDVVPEINLSQDKFEFSPVGGDSVNFNIGVNKNYAWTLKLSKQESSECLQDYSYEFHGNGNATKNWDGFGLPNGDYNVELYYDFYPDAKEISTVRIANPLSPNVTTNPSGTTTERGNVYIDVSGTGKEPWKLTVTSPLMGTPQVLESCTFGDKRVTWNTSGLIDNVYTITLELLTTRDTDTATLSLASIPVPSPTPTPTPSSSPTPTPSPSGTPGPSPSPSVEPTPNPSPSSTPTPQPTPTINPTPNPSSGGDKKPDNAPCDAPGIEQNGKNIPGQDCGASSNEPELLIEYMTSSTEEGQPTSFTQNFEPDLINSNKGFSTKSASVALKLFDVIKAVVASPLGQNVLSKVLPASVMVYLIQEQNRAISQIKSEANTTFNKCERNSISVGSNLNVSLFKKLSGEELTQAEEYLRSFSGATSIRILDSQNNVVKAFPEKVFLSGLTVIGEPWDGSNNNGKSVSDGIYTINIAITSLLPNGSKVKTFSLGKVTYSNCGLCNDEYQAILSYYNSMSTNITVPFSEIDPTLVNPKVTPTHQLYYSQMEKLREYYYERILPSKIKFLSHALAGHGGTTTDDFLRRAKRQSRFYNDKLLFKSVLDVYDYRRSTNNYYIGNNIQLLPSTTYLGYGYLDKTSPPSPPLNIIGYYFSNNKCEIRTIFPNL